MSIEIFKNTKYGSSFQVPAASEAVESLLQTIRKLSHSACREFEFVTHCSIMWPKTKEPFFFNEKKKKKLQNLIFSKRTEGREQKQQASNNEIKESYSRRNR